MDPLYTQHIQLSKQDISEQLSLFYKEDNKMEAGAEMLQIFS